MDRIANEGLRYNRMFSTALCSPTRAALITGRNHHSVGFGVISEQSTGFPGYNSIIDQDKATIGRPAGQRLRHSGSARITTRRPSRPARSGRSTSGPPAWASSISMGSSAATPTSGSRTCSATRHRSFRSGQPPGTWNLVTAMADDAIDYMTRMHQIQPDKPLFIKYAPGATHAPHHPTKEWVEKIRRCNSSTRAGTSCASASSRTRNGLA